MRSAFDKLISWTGLAVAAVLVVAGGLLTWAHFFVADQVHDQFSAQGITMPTAAQTKELSKADQKALAPFAGSKLDTGPEAKAFANHYIQAHMNAAGGGKTYEEVSGQYTQMTDAQKASAEGQQLAALRQTLFMGNTLRGLLLYGYAFATMGTLAGIAAIVSFVGAIVMAALGFLGLRHAAKPEASA